MDSYERWVAMVGNDEQTLNHKMKQGEQSFTLNNWPCFAITYIYKFPQLFFLFYTTFAFRIVILGKELVHKAEYIQKIQLSKDRT